MSYKAEAVANHFLDLADQSGLTLTAMQLQKLLFYAHGWHLAFTGQPLISSRFEAWQYGPVVRDVYLEFLHFGSKPLVGVRARSEGGHVQGGVYTIDDSSDCSCSPGQTDEVRQFLGNVFNRFGHLSGSQLSAMTHVDGGPWDQARKGSKGIDKPWIDDAVIRDYFQKCHKESRAY